MCLPVVTASLKSLDSCEEQPDAFWHADSNPGLKAADLRHLPLAQEIIGFLIGDVAFRSGLSDLLLPLFQALRREFSAAPAPRLRPTEQIS
jgi:hypothetical protein